MRRIIPTLVTVLFFAIITPIYGQSVSDEALQQCMNIKDASTRLVCYDSLTNSTSPTPEQEQQPYDCSDTHESWRAECGGDGIYQATQQVQGTQQVQDQPYYCSYNGELWRAGCEGGCLYETTQPVKASSTIVSKPHIDLDYCDGDSLACEAGVTRMTSRSYSITSSSSDSNCHSVGGYTLSNGTRVSGYTLCQE